MAQSFFQGFAQGFLESKVNRMAEEDKLQRDYVKGYQERIDSLNIQDELNRRSKEREFEFEQQKLKEERAAQAEQMKAMLSNIGMGQATRPMSAENPLVDTTTEDYSTRDFGLSGMQAPKGGEAFKSVSSIGKVPEVPQVIPYTPQPEAPQFTPEETSRIQSAVMSGDPKMLAKTYDDIQKQKQIQSRTQMSADARVKAAEIRSKSDLDKLKIPEETVAARIDYAKQSGLPVPELKDYARYPDKASFTDATKSELKQFQTDAARSRTIAMQSMGETTDTALQSLQRDPSLTGLSVKGVFKDVFKMFDEDVAALDQAQNLMLLLDKEKFGFPSANFSDADREFLKNITIDFRRDPQTVKNSLLAAKAASARILDYDNAKQNYISNVIPDSASFDKLWRQYTKAIPLGSKVNGQYLPNPKPMSFNVWIERGAKDVQRPPATQKNTTPTPISATPEAPKSFIQRIDDEEVIVTPR